MRIAASRPAPIDRIAAGSPDASAGLYAAGRRFDVVLLGRLAVDSYAEQIGAHLDDVTSFAMHLGGTSVNSAFGRARFGLRTGFRSCLGDGAGI